MRTHAGTILLGGSLMNLEGSSSIGCFFKRFEVLIRSSQGFCRTLLVAVIGIGALTGAPLSSVADSTSLDGSWRGSGWIKFNNGKRERASCKAYYRRVTPTEFALRANCATRSAKATQIARVHKTGKSKYSGNFFNQEYGVSGSIYVSVKGRSQRVRLSGSGGSATFNLRK